MEQNKFNPNEHAIMLERKKKEKDAQGRETWVTIKTEYLPVQWRLVWFREHCPLGSIETDLLRLDLELNIAVFKACVCDGHGAQACGHGSESFKDFPDYIEKAETKAIGRALAALGFGTQFCGDELNEGSRIVDSPVEKKMLTLGMVKRRAQDNQYAADSVGWRKFVIATLGVSVDDKDMSPEQLKLLYDGCNV